MPPVDPSLVGLTRGPLTSAYTWQDAALYALAVGAGPEEASLLYEGHPGGMQVLPSFAVVPALRVWPQMPGLVKPLMVHGEQSLVLHRPLPAQARVVLTSRVANIFDKGKGALIEVLVQGALEDGVPLFDTQWKVFYLGGGGFGGEPGPKAVIHAPPEREPDYDLTYRVPPQQAALYRLLGDLNPLHIDPQAAALAGFSRPVLHGLCTYGYACRALVNGPLGGEPDGLREYSARFAGPVFPGDELRVKIWRQGDECRLEAETPNGPVLKNGLAKLA
ncbi:MaoC/PaaZ C-terminal domain-containing protein [Desulfoferula mesophila]|uniref:3-alpha,7-alpha,12-alpha-trihydroxy-5-beta-cholest-24-enoyl-CoA hydratase n=1 Tax=Desulfoferula mesophila TaxID=3058419 RepID=A0AAU9EEY9_9BACT|nr:3-alpha,7-alpha,12-alpha-trihydroxy-5-beta-cholest-24-enoyl-CoA hydratase [Desulfoferula mesophilus]